jgi:hypothetical protein
MNYKNAPGRNWARPARRPGANLQPEALPRASFAAWRQAGDRAHVAGRNWARQPRKPRRFRLESTGADSASTEIYPLRERGGGDHDEPYDYRGPSTGCPLPFTLREYARLLVVKSRVAAQRLPAAS